ncbi:MAG: helix-turn-helix transcriptional regulator [Phycisphaerales bacterium]|jgi:DNA-binding CsgD family transcriptional regulator|nr:helix-turn-helix transcriptional regulator [Phycisphaerales bacterium]
MTNGSDGGLSRERVARMERLCAAAERVGAIAIAPSRLWCERVCTAVATGLSVDGGSAAALAITGRIDLAGRVEASELGGVWVDAGAGASSRAHARERANASAALACELRGQLSGVRSLGVRVDGRWPMVVALDSPIACSASLARLGTGWEMGATPGSSEGASERRGARVGAITTGRAALALWDVGQRQIAIVLRGGEPGEAAEMLWVLMPTIARRAAMALGANMLPRRQWLSPLEERVMEMLASGYDVPRIADILSRSRHTIHDHVKSLHSKMGINSRAELVARALGRLPAIREADDTPPPRPDPETEVQGTSASAEPLVD